MKKLLLGITLLTFAGFSVNAQTNQLSNPGFESWHNYTVDTEPPIDLEIADGWHGSDSLVSAISIISAMLGIEINAVKQVAQTDDAYEGTSAVEIKSAFVGDTLGNIAGIFSNAILQFDITDPSLDDYAFTGGTPVNKKIDTLTAWIKLTDDNTDSAAIGVGLFVGDEEIGGGNLTIAPIHNEYVQVYVPITYTTEDIPDRLVVAFSSSAPTNDIITPGNTLYVDEVSIITSEGGSSVPQPLFSENTLSVYPNPAKKEFYFNLNANAIPSQYQFSITDISGKVVYSVDMKQHINSFNTQSLAQGVYIYNLYNKNTNLHEKGKILIGE